MLPQFQHTFAVEEGQSDGQKRSNTARDRGSMGAKEPLPDSIETSMRSNSFETGGGDRIRTCDTRKRMLVFKTSAFNHSATPPQGVCVGCLAALCSVSHVRPATDSGSVIVRRGSISELVKTPYLILP